MQVRDPKASASAAYVRRGAYGGIVFSWRSPAPGDTLMVSLVLAPAIGDDGSRDARAGGSERLAVWRGPLLGALRTSPPARRPAPWRRDAATHGRRHASGAAARQRGCARRSHSLSAPPCRGQRCQGFLVVGRGSFLSSPLSFCPLLSPSCWHVSPIRPTFPRPAPPTCQAPSMHSLVEPGI